MLSELVCLGILQFMRGRDIVMTQDGPPFDEPKRSPLSDAALEGDVFRHMLRLYELADVEAAWRWVVASGLVSWTEFGLRGPKIYHLSNRGAEIAEKAVFPPEEQVFFYKVQPHQVFVAHQFTDADHELVGYLREKALEPRGFGVVEGKAEGLEQFREAILSKIHDSRFFVCLLTRKVALESGMYTSSVWLYQEIGAAMAYGRRPLLLVEEGIDPRYIGELQQVYEYLPFTRSNHPRVFDTIPDRLEADLRSALIPLPQGGDPRNHRYRFHEKPAYVNHLAKNIPASLTESETLSCFHSHSLSASRVTGPGARWGPISPALQSESRPL